MTVKQLALLVSLLLAAGSLGVGCASGSQSTSEDDEEVSASPPSPEEDTRGELPEGPEVDMGRSGASQSGDDATGEDGADEPEADDVDAEAITRSELETFREKGPSYALTQVEVEPSRKDGTFEGFKIVSMRPNAQEAVDGQIQEGDVITHINGVRLEKPDDYLDAWKLLGEVSSIRIDFIRGGDAQHAVWRVE